ncbi:MAG: tRNA pseudouridine(55) synthase TruB [Verrucomicrobiae bacterium]|nr:tRNA pseudouridine(55) synthase TruB [Verrucomicrobiae bacterium]MDW8344300.1 tRNA pseudouridine(55) synthase TruB [Verrucomicrobiae bacterium]
MRPELTVFDGVLLVDKPRGPTSHDVVDQVRRHFGFRKVGHCGTLDPMATGLLVLVLERATKIQQRLMSDDKTYEGILRLGIITDSHDADGRVVAEQPVPPLTPDDLEAVLAKFRGDIWQTPPMVSAVKHAGTPLYKLARKGQVIEREPRLVHIYELTVLEFEPPDVRLRVTCTKGTYVRTLCHDIGVALGCGGHLAALRRTRSGRFDVSDALPLDRVMTLTREQLVPHIVPLLQLAAR